MLDVEVQELDVLLVLGRELLVDGLEVLVLLVEVLDVEVLDVELLVVGVLEELLEELVLVEDVFDEPMRGPSGGYQSALT